MNLASLENKRVLVVGLGRFGGGVGVTRWLVDQRASVTVTDQADASTLTDSINELAGLPVTFRLGGHTPDDLNDIDLVIINPAVVKTKSEFFSEVLARNIAWTTEMNLFCERCPADAIGVTGSFGKSTTCAVLAEVLTQAAKAIQIPHRAVHLGGNIGRSLLPELPNIGPNDLVVLEMSNAQLEDLPRIEWTPMLAAITNLFPHHLDRHGTFEAYIDAKLNIVRLQELTRRLIVGELHPVAEARLRNAMKGRTDSIIPTARFDRPFDLKTPGAHNQRNAACVATICREMNIPDAFTRDALSQFTGLPHRLQHVATIDGVSFYNDSKSTSPSATVVAVESFDNSIVLILCGQRKDVSLEELAKAVSKNCKAVICAGDAGPVFAAGIRDSTECKFVKVLEVDSIQKAISSAREFAKPGDAILFSPGAPSFDAYVNFEARGHHFAKLVHQLESQSELHRQPAGADRRAG